MQHWRMIVDDEEPFHVGQESAFDDDSPCVLPDPDDSIVAGSCGECGTDVYKVNADASAAACEECGTSYQFSQGHEDDMVWG